MLYNVSALHTNVVLFSFGMHPLLLVFSSCWCNGLFPFNFIKTILIAYLFWCAFFSGNARSLWMAVPWYSVHQFTGHIFLQKTTTTTGNEYNFANRSVSFSHSIGGDEIHFLRAYIIIDTQGIDERYRCSIGIITWCSRTIDWRCNFCITATTSRQLCKYSNNFTFIIWYKWCGNTNRKISNVERLL